MKSNVYTRTGDGGKASLIGGTRVSKCDPRLEAYGTVDELSAQLGLLVTYLTDPADRQTVQRVQNDLFAVAASLATDTSKMAPLAGCQVTEAMIQQLEAEIDRLDAALPKLKQFILPGGCRGAAVAHVCRTVCRRTERRILTLSAEAPVEAHLLSYINRLSDYLFVLSRKINYDEKNDEIIWCKRR